MLVVVQIPIIDLRLLQDDAGPLIRAPRWRRPRFFPAAQRDFVRGIGAVSPRKQEAPWQAESFYVDTKNTVRFAPDLTGTGLIPRFRRLYHEELTYRLEVGVTTDWEHRYSFHEENPPWSLARAALALAVHLPGGEPVELANFGPLMAQRLARATVPAGTAPAPVRRSLLVGTAAVIVEWRGDTPLDRPAFTQEWLTLPHARVSGWLLQKSTYRPPAGQTRLLRLHITRMHADLALTETILAACEERLIDERSEPVLRCLDRLATRLNKTKLHSYEQRDAVRRIAQRAREHYAGKSDTLIRLREHIDSDPIKRNLRYLAENFGGSLVLDGGTVVNVKVNGTGNVTQVGQDQELKIQGSVVGSPGASLSDLAGELVRELALLRDKLGDAAPDVEDAAEGLRREAEKDEPNHGGMRRRLSTIAEVVGKLGKAGIEVINLIDKIGALIPS
jgi:hypothetical protein